MSELKAVFESTTTRRDTSWKTTTPLTRTCSNDGVIQLGPLSSDAMFEVAEISDANFIYFILKRPPHTVVNQIYVWQILRPR